MPNSACGRDVPRDVVDEQRTKISKNRLNIGEIATNTVFPLK
jgi:hypothetical protein